MSTKLLMETASQTAGPYVHIGLALAAAGNPVRTNEIWNRLASPEAPGEHIRLVGRVVDGNGHLVRDGFLECWQADGEGKYQTDYNPDNTFNSFGRTATTFDAGEWEIFTVKPGIVHDAAGKAMAPHVNLTLFARGINVHLNTRLYFADEETANLADPILNFIEQPERRQTLIAQVVPDADVLTYRFDIRIQGERETVFFDF